MKQDILCPKCARERRKRYPTNEPFPGEFIKFVRGIALKDMLCDGCGVRTEIKRGDEVYAYSNWTSTRSYYEWEEVFIKIT